LFFFYISNKEPPPVLFLEAALRAHVAFLRRSRRALATRVSLPPFVDTPFPTPPRLFFHSRFSRNVTLSKVGSGVRLVWKFLTLSVVALRAGAPSPPLTLGPIRFIRLPCTGGPISECAQLYDRTLCSILRSLGIPLYFPFLVVSGFPPFPPR